MSIIFNKNSSSVFQQYNCVKESVNNHSSKFKQRFSMNMSVTLCTKSMEWSECWSNKPVKEKETKKITWKKTSAGNSLHISCCAKNLKTYMHVELACPVENNKQNSIYLPVFYFGKLKPCQLKLRLVWIYFVKLNSENECVWR